MARDEGLSLHQHQGSVYDQDQGSECDQNENSVLMTTRALTLITLQVGLRAREVVESV